MVAQINKSISEGSVFVFTNKKSSTNKDFSNELSNSFIGFFKSFSGTETTFASANQLPGFVDKLLERTPGIKYIYSTTRDFFEAFAGDKKKFTKNVLANVDGNNVWRLGFITRDDMHDFGLKDYVAVYIPMAYSVSGNVYIIPKENVKLIENISAAQTMKFAVSGGVTDLHEPESK